MSKVILILIAVLLAAFAADLDNSATTRAEIISRAKTWLNPPVPYSQTSTKNGYRCDCSGYVSMAWGLSTPGATTSTLPNYSKQITKDSLLQGDILLNKGDHTLIFDSWANSGKTSYWAYEQSGSSGTQYHSVTYPYWSNYHPENYFPYRLTGLTSSNSSDIKGN